MLEKLFAAIEVGKEQFGNYSALSRASGVSEANISRWRKRTQVPKISDYASILTAVNAQLVYPGEALRHYVFIPCGAPTVVNDSLMLAGAGHNPIAFDRGWLENKRINPDQAVMVIANAGNMAPTFSQGELVLVDKSDTRPQPNGIFLLILRDRPDFRRLISTTQGWTLHCDSPQWAMHCETVPNLDDITIVGRVRWAGRMFD